MKSTIDSVFPVGKFDKSFFLVEGNRLMYDFMGSHIYSSLYKIIPKDDVEQLDAARARCKKSAPEGVDICLHILNASGGYDRFLVNLQGDGNFDSCYMEFQNMSSSEQELANMSRRCFFMQDYLTVSGMVYMSYRPEENNFRLFWMDYEQVVEIYAMPLEEWRDMVISKGMVTGRDREVFNVFCDSLRNAERSQTYTFHGSILSRGETVDAYRIKYIPRTYDGKKTVVGIWTVFNEQTGNIVDDYVEGTNVDSMTRILNKKAIADYAEKTVKAGTQTSIIMMDIDNFKTINDSYGHIFGDQVIIAVADVIKKAIGENGAAGRVGGDEFMVVIKNFGDEAGLRNYLRTIKSNVQTLFQDKLGANRITCSIGASRSEIDSNEYKELLQIADKALYIAKQKGKNRFIIYMQEKHGQFHMSDDGSGMMEIRDSYYSEHDLNRFNELLAGLVINGIGNLARLLEHARHTLEMDRLIVAWGDEPLVAAVKNGECWEKDERRIFLKDKQYIELFTEDVLSITNINMLEYNHPEAYDAFVKNNVRSFVQHLLRNENGEVNGMVLVEDCMNLKHFPKLAMQMFGSMCRIINAVLLRENGCGIK